MTCTYPRCHTFKAVRLRREHKLPVHLNLPLPPALTPPTHALAIDACCRIVRKRYAHAGAPGAATNRAGRQSECRAAAGTMLGMT
eukprot:352336-Chlamydomonas_euryale.AAC.8